MCIIGLKQLTNIGGSYIAMMIAKFYAGGGLKMREIKAAAQHPSQRGALQAVLFARMAEHPQQAIPFRDYMEICLYHPVYGYYMREERKIGKEGDFYTSSAIGTVLGDILAEMYIRWAAERNDERCLMAEWGGGDGRLARHVLDRLLRQDEALYQRTELLMIERSPYHRRLQQAELAEHRQKVRWLDEEEWRREAPWRSIYMWANELLDAMPVHRVKMTDGVLHEEWVRWDQDEQRLEACYYPAAEELVRYAAEQGIRLAEGQLAELRLDAERWIMELGMSLAEGEVTLIDYGDEAEEIYAPHRMLGTLLCYYRHQASDRPYDRIGEQDITAHVDFTACRRAAEKAGFSEIRLETQAAYLLRGGVLNWLQDHHDPDPFSPAARRNRSIRQLLLSDQMSELFKVMTMRKSEGLRGNL